MRFLIFILFIVCNTLLVNAQNLISKQTIVAIDYIHQGYGQFGFEELKKSARINDIVAQYYIGCCYEHGFFVEKNMNEAFFYFRKAAERGLPDAMYRMACFYEYGVVVTQDSKRSSDWKVRFEAKGGKLILPNFQDIYNEGLTHSERYALIPNDGLVANNSLFPNNNVSNSQTINNITIVQQAQNEPKIQQDKNADSSIKEDYKSDIDINIPQTNVKNNNTFALIIANENYQDVAKVTNAINDGEVFAEYCQKTLGLPASNVILIKDATFNNIKREINKLSQIANVYNGSAKIIFYYAGHGIPNETTKDAFLLPVDGYGTDTSTGFSLSELYSTFGEMPAEQIIVLLDACFSGSQRGEGMLASARGVAIKPKANKIDGKMVVISAAQGDETAYSYQEEGHGLFTYFLLKSLKETKGNVTLGDLASYIKDNVSKKSIVVNGKSQTPNVNPSATLGDSWKIWTLK